jgi:hypothetical protein
VLNRLPLLIAAGGRQRGDHAAAAAEDLRSEFLVWRRRGRRSEQVPEVHRVLLAHGHQLQYHGIHTAILLECNYSTHFGRAARLLALSEVVWSVLAKKQAKAK